MARADHARRRAQERADADDQEKQTVRGRRRAQSGAAAATVYSRSAEVVMVRLNTSSRRTTRYGGTATVWRGAPARPEFRSLAGPHAGPPIYRIPFISATRRPSIRTLGRYAIVETTLRPADVDEGVADAQDLAIRIVTRSTLADTVLEGSCGARHRAMTQYRFTETTVDPSEVPPGTAETQAAATRAIARCLLADALQTSLANTKDEAERALLHRLISRLEMPSPESTEANAH
jgi:hypothetical protein